MPCNSVAIAAAKVSDLAAAMWDLVQQSPAPVRVAFEQTVAERLPEWVVRADTNADRLVFTSLANRDARIYWYPRSATLVSTKAVRSVRDVQPVIEDAITNAARHMLSALVSADLMGAGMRVAAPQITDSGAIVVAFEEAV